MVGRGAVGVLMVFVVGLIAIRAMRDASSTAEPDRAAAKRNAPDPNADDDMDLLRFNKPRVGWVFGQLMGAETPGPAPTRRETREHLMNSQPGVRFAVSPDRWQR